MKLKELKSIVKTAVKEAIQEELKETGLYHSYILGRMERDM